MTGSFAVIIRLAFVLIVFVAIGAAFFVGQYTAQKAPQENISVTQPEITELEQNTQADIFLEKVDKLIMLPSGEAPSVAVIEDAASAKSAQPFLEDAQNGDVLIVYSQNQFALLYRPGDDKLVAVGPVLSDEQSVSENGNDTINNTSSFENE